MGDLNHRLNHIMLALLSTTLGLVARTPLMHTPMRVSATPLRASPVVLAEGKEPLPSHDWVIET